MKVRIASKGKLFQIVDLVVRKFAIKILLKCQLLLVKTKKNKFVRFTEK